MFSEEQNHSQLITGALVPGDYQLLNKCTFMSLQLVLSALQMKNLSPLLKKVNTIVALGILM